MGRMRWILVLAALGLTSVPQASAGTEVGGYARVMARPDLDGGDGRLGYWNLYGRLLNEGPYAAMQLRTDLLAPQPGSTAPWGTLHTRVEGGSIAGMDSGGGSLENLRLSQVYMESGNVLFRDVTWRVGSLYRYIGDLGLYDFRPADLFVDTVGIAARYETASTDLLIGFGDSGYGLDPNEYNAVFTPGGWWRQRIGDRVEVGLGGEWRFERQAAGHRYAPYQTPGVDYEDFVRGEVVQSWLEMYPDRLDAFPDPEPAAASSFKLIASLGFGGIGPLTWNNLFANFQRLHPEDAVTESANGEEVTVYVTEMTDERYQINIGNEMHLTLSPRLELAWAMFYGDYWDNDNDIAPSDHDRWFASTVVRAQWAWTDTVHWLVESSFAREHSRNGNQWREHADSIFSSTEGFHDTQGLEYGDTNERDTWQGKTGVVLNPLGPGIYARPSLRLLYGVQRSNQNNAFGNAFVETVDQYDDFDNVERHWHHVLALEAEAWF